MAYVDITGKWALYSSEGFEDYLKAVGKSVVSNFIPLADDRTSHVSICRTNRFSSGGSRSE